MKNSMVRTSALVLAAAALLLVGSAPSGAEIYRWVDGNGVTHFSDRKPTGEDRGREETVDPSRPGSLSVIEGGTSQGEPVNYVDEILVREDRPPGLNRNASVVIYTTPT